MLCFNAFVLMPHFFCTQLTVTNALPAMPEVNEEHSGRSTSPETNKSLQTASDTTGIYNYGQSYSAYYPTKFIAKRRSSTTFSKTKRKKPPKKRCCLFRTSGCCFGRSRSGAYRVRNDTLPYFVRNSSIRPVGFNKISPPLLRCKHRQQQQQQQQRPLQSQEQIDVTKGRIRMNLYAYPREYLKFLESYFTCTAAIGNDDDDDDRSTKKRLSAISEEALCPLCGSPDYGLQMKTTGSGRWKSALLVPF